MACDNCRLCGRDLLRIRPPVECQAHYDSKVRVRCGSGMAHSWLLLETGAHVVSQPLAVTTFGVSDEPSIACARGCLRANATYRLATALKMSAGSYHV